MTYTGYALHLMLIIVSLFSITIAATVGIAYHHKVHECGSLRHSVYIGMYEPFEQKIYVSTKNQPPKKVLRTLYHEYGHHIYDTALTAEQRSRTEGTEQFALSTEDVLLYHMGYDTIRPDKTTYDIYREIGLIP